MTVLCSECPDSVDFQSVEARMAHRLATGHKAATERYGTTPPPPPPAAAPAATPAFRTADPSEATKAQKDYIRVLLTEREGIPAAEAIRETLNTWRTQPGGLTKAGASKAISDLKAIPRPSKVLGAPEPTTPAKPVVRTNRYAGKCEECGLRVEAGEGILSKTDSGAWEVAHKDGECPASAFPFPNGRYAIEDDEGGVHFYAVTPEGLFVQASDDLHRVHPNAQAAIIEAIKADPMAASIRYGQEFETCGRCGRGLTSDWRKVGIGPVCSKKGWD